MPQPRSSRGTDSDNPRDRLHRTPTAGLEDRSHLDAPSRVQQRRHSETHKNAEHPEPPRGDPLTSLDLRTRLGRPTPERFTTLRPDISGALPSHARRPLPYHRGSEAELDDPNKPIVGFRRCLRGADRVPGTQTLCVYPGPHGAARCISVQRSREHRRRGYEARRSRRHGPPDHSMHLRGIRCCGVGERTRTSTPIKGTRPST